MRARAAGESLRRARRGAVAEAEAAVVATAPAAPLDCRNSRRIAEIASLIWASLFSYPNKAAWRRAGSAFIGSSVTCQAEITRLMLQRVNLEYMLPWRSPSLFSQRRISFAARSRAPDL